MKTTLIIFLFLISSLIYMIIFYKSKVKVNIIINNDIWTLKCEIFHKRIFKENKITIDMIINTVIEKIKNQKSLKNIKLGKTSIREIGEILEVIEIEEANIDLKIGTPFLVTTISLVTFVSSIIPVIYEKTDNRNGKLFYNILPNFHDFEFVGEVNLIFKITFFEFIWIINYLKKKNNKQIKRRKNHEQSSYRGVDEYSYE